MKNQFEIEISPNKYGSEWRNVWNKNNFSGWDDGCHYIFCNYTRQLYPYYPMLATLIH